MPAETARHDEAIPPVARAPDLRTSMIQASLALDAAPRPAGITRFPVLAPNGASIVLPPMNPAPRREPPLWTRVGLEANPAAAREPLLGPRLEALVLRPVTPCRILAAVLARGLAGDDARLETIVDEALLLAREALERIEEDLETVAVRDPACHSVLHALLHLKGFQALAAHRVAHSLWTRGRRDAGAWVAHRS